MNRRITVDQEICDGYGNCVFVAPQIFDLNDDNRAVLLADEVTDDNHDAVDLAVGECPTRAITITT
jgi:ferredoxin